MAEIPHHRPLADFRLDDISVALNSSMGGYYDVNNDEFVPNIEDSYYGDNGEIADDDEVEDSNWISVEHTPSHERYSDMEDFTTAISDPRTSGWLVGTIQGSGAFKRFRNARDRFEPALLDLWYLIRNLRDEQRAIEWLLDHEFITTEEGESALSQRRAQTIATLALVSLWRPE